MDRKKLLKEYAIKYEEYLYGKCSWHDVFALIEQEEDLLWDSDEEIAKVREEVVKKYRREVTEPLFEELLEFLQFKGLVKGPEYERRAKELAEKLKNCDGHFYAREEAMDVFFKHTKIGSRYDEDRKLALALRLGALDFEN